MLLGPIFSVELLTSARRARYFVLRVVYAAILLIGLGLVYQAHFRHGADRASIAAVAEFAYSFFITFAIIQLMAVLLLAPAMAAGTIATERERRTIEYLFVSHLTNVEIVFGKLAARLVQIICLMLVGLPVLSLAGLMGGIAPEALLGVFLVTLSTVVCVAILSISISVWSARARDAVVRAYLVLLCLVVLPLVVEETLPGYWLYDKLLAPVNGQLLAANPFWLLDSLLFGGSTNSGVWGVLLDLVRNQMIASAVALVAATLAVRWVHLRARTVEAKQRFRLTRHLRPELGDRPMLWKEVFAEPGLSRLGWLGRIAVLLIVLAVLGPTLYQFGMALDPRASSYRWGRDYEWFIQFAASMSTLVACGALLLIAARSAASITSEKERESWVSVLSTPLGAGEIVLAKTLGSIYSVRLVFLLLAVIWLLMLYLVPAIFISFLFTLATLAVVAFAVSSLGVLMSLWCKNSLRAMATTIGICLFVGGGYLFCCMFFVFASGPGSDDAMQVIAGPCIPFLLTLPTIIYTESDHIMQRDSGFLVGYMLGMLFYGIAGWLLSASAISNFDQLSERTGTMAPPRTPRSPLQPVVLAETVEEEA